MVKNVVMGVAKMSVAENKLPACAGHTNIERVIASISWKLEVALSPPMGREGSLVGGS